jgi:hypothetical protein
MRIVYVLFIIIFAGCESPVVENAKEQDNAIFETDSRGDEGSKNRELKIAYFYSDTAQPTSLSLTLRHSKYTREEIIYRYILIFKSGRLNSCDLSIESYVNGALFNNRKLYNRNNENEQLFLALEEKVRHIIKKYDLYEHAKEKIARNHLIYMRNNQERLMKDEQWRQNHLRPDWILEGALQIFPARGTYINRVLW